MFIVIIMMQTCDLLIKEFYFTINNLLVLYIYNIGMLIYDRQMAEDSHMTAKCMSPQIYVIPNLVNIKPFLLNASLRHHCTQIF